MSENFDNPAFVSQTAECADARAAERWFAREEKAAKEAGCITGRRSQMEIGDQTIYLFEGWMLNSPRMGEPEWSLVLL
jgi:hypothetical protein